MDINKQLFLSDRLGVMVSRQEQCSSSVFPRIARYKKLAKNVIKCSGYLFLMWTGIGYLATILLNEYGQQGEGTYFPQAFFLHIEVCALILTILSVSVFGIDTWFQKRIRDFPLICLFPLEPPNDHPLLPFQEGGGK